MLPSGPNYLSHESEKPPLGILLGAADGASPAEPDVPFRQTAKFSIEHVYRGICRHLSGNHPIDWYSNVRYRTVGCTVRDVAQSLQVPEPLPHFGSAPRFSLLVGKVGGHMMTLQASCNNNTITGNTINEACAGILLGMGLGNTVTPNTFMNVGNTTLAGDSCSPTLTPQEKHSSLRSKR